MLAQQDEIKERDLHTTDVSHDLSDSARRQNHSGEKDMRRVSMDKYEGYRTKCYAAGAGIRRLGRRLLLIINAFMFVLYGTAGIWCLVEWWRCRPDTETKAYIQSTMAGGDPYLDIVKDSLERYLLPGQEIEVKRTDYRQYDSIWGTKNYEIWEEYACALWQDNREVISFSATVVEADFAQKHAQEVLAIQDSKCVVVTDFVQNLFEYFLLQCNEAYKRANGRYVFSMREYETYRSDGWSFYEGLALNNVYSLDEEGMEWLFREAYQDMHEWQREVSVIAQTELWVSKHLRPLRYGNDYPIHLLTFSAPYGVRQQEIFLAMTANIVDLTMRKSSYDRKTWLNDIRLED